MYANLDSESRQVIDMRVIEVFNRYSLSEICPEAVCTYRLFQMQQTHKFAVLSIELSVDIFEISTAAELLDLRAEKTGGVSQKLNNVIV